MLGPGVSLNLDLYNIIGLFNNVFTSCSEWFTKLISNYADIYFFGILIVLAFRYFIHPVVGSSIRFRGSDRANSVKKKGGVNNG